MLDFFPSFCCWICDACSLSWACDCMCISCWRELLDFNFCEINQELASGFDPKNLQLESMLILFSLPVLYYYQLWLIFSPGNSFMIPNVDHCFQWKQGSMGSLVFPSISISLGRFPNVPKNKKIPSIYSHKNGRTL